MSIWPRHLRHVVLVTPRHPEMSGGSTFVRNLQHALETDGVAVDVVSVWPGTTGGRPATLTVYPDEQLHRGPVLRGQGGLKSRARSLPRLVRKRVQRARQHRRLNDLLGSLGPDSVVIFTHPLGKIAAEDAGWRREAGGPVLIGQHHSQFRSLEDETWLAEAIPRYFSDVDAFVALTEDDAEQFAQILPVPCFGIGNPMSHPPEAAPQTPQVSASHAPTAVALARFSQEKRLDVMIRCFALATEPKHLRHWQLHLYGEGDQRHLLEQQIQDTGVADRARLEGRTNDPYGVLLDAELNLLTSEYEGFGMTLLEAGAVGTPSIAFDCSPGVHFLLSDGAGVLVPPGDENAYVDALRALMEDRDRRAEIGATALARAQTFGPEAVLQRWARMLEQVVPPA